VGLALAVGQAENQHIDACDGDRNAVYRDRSFAPLGAVALALALEVVETMSKKISLDTVPTSTP
jgi:hypothetical protein